MEVTAGNTQNIKGRLQMRGNKRGSHRNTRARERGRGSRNTAKGRFPGGLSDHAVEMS